MGNHGQFPDARHFMVRRTRLKVVRDYLENLSLTLTGLEGENTIDIFAFNSVDNSSNVLSFNFTGITAVPEPAGAVVVLMFGMVAMSRRKRQ